MYKNNNVEWKDIAEIAFMFGAEQKVVRLKDVINKYMYEKDNLPPPQLSVASWIVAGLSVNAMFNLVTGREIKFFPKFYLSSIMGD